MCDQEADKECKKTETYALTGLQENKKVYSL